MPDQTQAVFEGAAGAVRLGVEGYEFPNITNSSDSNWLVIVGEALLNGDPWGFRHASLTSGELSLLADWLDQTHDRTAKNRFCHFMEQNFEFERRSDDFIRISLSQEARPPWAEISDEVGFDIPIDDRIKIAAKMLRKMVSRFPDRT